jgi:cytidine deaminase
MKTFPLDTEDRALIGAAEEVIRTNFSQPRHTVGAALRCGSGAVYTGVNIDSTGYGPCAEPVALGAAISSGEREFQTIVAVCGPKKDYEVISPCGNCRQLLADYAPDVMVVLTVDGELRKARAADLLPEAYRNSRSDTE